MHTRVLSLDNVRITEFGRGSLLNDLREIENSNYGRPRFCLSRKVALVDPISEKPCSGPWFSRARSPKKWWKKLSEHNFYEISLPKAWETDTVTGKRLLGPTFFQSTRLQPVPAYITLDLTCIECSNLFFSNDSKLRGFQLFLKFSLIWSKCSVFLSLKIHFRVLTSFPIMQHYSFSVQLNMLIFA